MVLRVREPNRERPFKTPAVWVVGPVSIAGCGFLFFSLPPATQLTFLYWTIAGLVIYFAYGFRNSPLAKRG